MGTDSGNVDNVLLFTYKHTLEIKQVIRVEKTRGAAAPTLELLGCISWVQKNLH